VAALEGCVSQLGACASADTLDRAAGAFGISQESGGALLVDYFNDLLKDQDVEAFRGRVRGRYDEATLDRIATGSHVATARRAAILALGLLGSFDRSNAVLGRALRDPDQVARSLAEESLWALWFRADTPENNQMLERVRVLIGRNRLDEAEALATRLIAIAPNFAEAYNQRAFAFFLQGRLTESAADCQQVLLRNPFHIGAIEGLAKCQLGLGRPVAALEALRKALKLRPHNSALRHTVKQLEESIGELPHP
jgi:tetratricopeptide (TPR) repeat protein